MDLNFPHTIPKGMTLITFCSRVARELARGGLQVTEEIGVSGSTIPTTSIDPLYARGHDTPIDPDKYQPALRQVQARVRDGLTKLLPPHLIIQISGHDGRGTLHVIVDPIQRAYQYTTLGPDWPGDLQNRIAAPATRGGR